MSERIDTDGQSSLDPNNSVEAITNTASTRKLKRKYRRISLLLTVIIFVSSAALIKNLWTGWVSFSGEQYYLVKGEKMVGMSSIDNERYFFDTDGAMQTGWQTIDGDTFYFGNNGTMQIGWVMVSDKNYYLGSNGVMQTGWQEINGEKYYFDENGIMQTGWQTIDGAVFCLDTAGVLQTGFQTQGAKKYYFDDETGLHIGWLTIGTQNYYCSPSNNGVVATGKWVIDDQGYYFNSDGVMATGQVEVSPNTVYQFSEDGHFQYYDTTQYNPGDKGVAERRYFSNRNGGNSWSDTYRQLDKAFENILSVTMEIEITQLNYGTGNGQWQIYVRTLDGKWKRISYITVEEGFGEVSISFDSPISFDAFVCGGYDTGGWSGQFRQGISEITYRTYDFGSGGRD